jgi:hypothetical protein
MSRSRLSKGRVLLPAVFLLAAQMLFLIFPLHNAEGAMWVPVARSNGGNDLHYIDSDNIQWRSEHIVSAPSKVEKELPEVFGPAYLKRMTGVEEWHCTEKKSRSLSLTMHFTDGTRLSDHPPTNWNTIIPKTVEEAIWKFLCK